MEIDRLYMSTHSECHTPTSPQEFNYKLSDSGARNLFTNNNMHGRDWLARLALAAGAGQGQLRWDYPQEFGISGIRATPGKPPAKFGG